MIELLHEIKASRGVSVAALCEALEEALPAAYKRHVGDVDVRAHVDRETAEIALQRRRVVVDELSDPAREIAIAVAPEGYEAGDFVDEPIDLGRFGRIAALTAKRVVATCVLAWEREAVFVRYRALQGTIVRGLVQREIHGHVYVVFDDGNEACLPRSERAPRDRFEINDLLEAELHTVARTPRGPALIPSRNRAGYVRALFGPGVLAAARRSGFVTYLALATGADTKRVAEIARAIGEHTASRQIDKRGLTSRLKRRSTPRTCA